MLTPRSSVHENALQAFDGVWRLNLSLRLRQDLRPAGSRFDLYGRDPVSLEYDRACFADEDRRLSAHSALKGLW